MSSRVSAVIDLAQPCVLHRRLGLGLAERREVDPRVDAALGGLVVPRERVVLSSAPPRSRAGPTLKKLTPAPTTSSSASPPSGVSRVALGPLREHDREDLAAVEQRRAVRVEARRRAEPGLHGRSAPTRQAAASGQPLCKRNPLSPRRQVSRNCRRIAWNGAAARHASSRSRTRAPGGSGEGAVVTPIPAPAQRRAQEERGARRVPARGDDARPRSPPAPARPRRSRPRSRPCCGRADRTRASTGGPVHAVAHQLRLAGEDDGARRRRRGSRRARAAARRRRGGRRRARHAGDSRSTADETRGHGRAAARRSSRG